MGRFKPKWRINRRAALILTVSAVALGAGVLLVNQLQERRLLREALLLAKLQREQGRIGLALQNLNACLEAEPEDVEALDLKSQILSEAAGSPGQFLEAAAVHEQVIRFGPDRPEAQAARRRLVELYLRYGDAIRASTVYRVAPELAANDLRYHAAERVARELIRRGATDADSHSLLARALEGCAVPGDEQALEAAVEEFERVLQRRPGDPVASERLARIYSERLKDNAHADRLLDDMLRVAPKSAKIRMERYQYQVDHGRPAAAAAELEAALELAPEDLSIRLTAVGDALRRGDASAARNHLNQVPAAAQRDPRVLLMRGIADLSSDRLDGALEAWRSGLKEVAGADADLTWWLAYALTRSGRSAEAQAPLAQLRRLIGGEAPLVRLLEALGDERAGRLTRAIGQLEKLRQELGSSWLVMVNLALGRCYQSLGDDGRAVAAYREACRVSPTAVDARVAAARLLQKRNPEEAIDELSRGLARRPGDPELLIARAEARLRQQVARREGTRTWDDFDRDVEQAERAAPSSAAIVVLKADRLAVSGAGEASVQALVDASGRAPGDALLALAASEKLAQSGKPAESLTVLEHAASAHDSGTLRVARSRMLEALNRGRDAREVLESAIDRVPAADRPGVWAALGSLLTRLGDTAGAVAVYRDWAALCPADPSPRLELLELAYRSGNAEQFHTAVESVRPTPGGDDIAWRLGRCRELLRTAADKPAGTRSSQGAPEGLAEADALARALAVDAPEVAAVQLLLGDVLERAGDVDGASAAYRRASDLGMAPSLSRLVDLLAAHKRLGEVERFRTAANAAQLDRLTAQAYLRQGDKAAARRVVNSASGDGPEAIAWRAAALAGLGDVDAAEGLLQQDAERNPAQLGPWLTLLAYQGGRGRSAAVEATIANILKQVKTDRPELLDAECRLLAGDLAGADRRFDAALSKWPDDAEVAVKAADFFEKRGQASRAEQCLARVSGQPAGARRLALLWTSRAHDRETWQRAWRVLTASRTGADSPEDRLARALLLERSSDPEKRAEAIAEFEALLADVSPERPLTALAEERLTALLLAKGDASRACTVAARGVARRNDPTTIASYAGALIKARQFEAAEQQLDRLANVAPGDSRAGRLRAHLAWERVQPSEAAGALEKAYQSVEQTAQGDAFAREALRLLNERPAQEGDEAAVRLAERIATRAPGMSWGFAQALARRGASGRALDLCVESARSSNAEDRNAAAQLAVALAYANNADRGVLTRAEKVVEAAMRSGEPTDLLMTVRAALLHRMERHADEVAQWREIVKREPGHALALNNLAWALSEELTQPSEALEAVEAAIRIGGRRPAFLDTRGLILARMNRHDEAIKDLNDAVALESTPARQLHLAQEYRAVGRIDESRAVVAALRRGKPRLDAMDSGDRRALEAMLAE